MKKILAISVVVLMTFLLACTSVEQSSDYLPPIQPNPNGDSELALLMRDMFDDGMRMKQLIKAGRMPEVMENFKKIHSAQATEPEKAASKKFKMFADAYLNSLENLKRASPDGVKDLYNGVVESCMSCHRALCPGPVVRIKKLYLK